MDEWRPTTLSWSFSSKTHFDDCKRYYFYNRFWGQDPKLKWRLYMMRNMTTIAMLRGAVVHQVISDALTSIRDGRQPQLEDAQRAVTKYMWEAYSESENRLWDYDNRPPDRRLNTITNLLEHFYTLPNAKQRAREARDAAQASIEALMTSDLWTEIANSDTGNWREFEDDGFPTFDIDGIKVFARVDFAHANGEPTIIDWKTGNPGEAERNQLTLYSLYAQSKWEWDPLQTKLCAVYLQPELTVDAFTPTPEDVERTIETVKTSFAGMLELEPAYGLADIEGFPPSDEEFRCRWCRFQGVCDVAAQRLSVQTE